jgi:hypothetical protein
VSLDLDVSRSRFNDLLERAGDDDALLAELLIVEDGDLVHEQREWYDARNPRTSTKHEVKSVREVVDGRDEDEFVPVTGRVRLWEGQVRSLVASDANGTAWIDFLLFDEDRTPQQHRRMKPGTVLKMVNELGGWDDAGHEEKGKQKKIPWPEVF